MISNIEAQNFTLRLWIFRDACGSLDQNDLIRTLFEVGINKDYCLLIADIYQESHFQVIC